MRAQPGFSVTRLTLDERKHNYSGHTPPGQWQKKGFRKESGQKTKSHFYYFLLWADACFFHCVSIVVLPTARGMDRRFLRVTFLFRFPLQQGSSKQKSLLQHFNFY